MVFVGNFAHMFMGTELCDNFLAVVSTHRSGEKILMSREISDLIVR